MTPWIRRSFASLGVLITVATSTVVMADARATPLPPPTPGAADMASDTLQTLAVHPEWLRLLHYRADEGIGGRVRFRSAVEDARFFLAPQGPTDPYAELTATLQHFHKSDDFSDDSANCRFVARRQWLAQQLGITHWDDPAARCALYQEWRTMIRAGRATLVFPGYHLNSPSSMFGHTLLRIDPIDDASWTEWLGFSVSFGADIRQQDNSMLYAWKGLTGGYPGNFIVTPYFEKIREYSKIDNRDIWEYPLNLSPIEVDRLVTHLWELKEINFAYYFFDENCSYRLLELLEVARPGLDLTSEFVLTAIPVDTIRAVAREELIEDTVFRPSRAALLRARIARLPAHLVPHIQRLAADPDFVNALWFDDLKPIEQALLLDAAYEHHSYRNRKKTATPALAQQSHAMLRALSERTAPTPPIVPRPAPPEAAHDSKRLAFGGGEIDGQPAARLDFRMSFHKLEDRPVGFLTGAQINLFSADFSLIDDTPRVERVDLVDILSLTDWTPLFPDISWGVRTGVDRVQAVPGRPLVPQVEASVGMSRHFRDMVVIYGMARARADHARQNDDPSLRTMAGPAAGVLFSHPRASLHVNADRLFATSGQRWDRADITASWHASRNLALRLSYHHENDPRFPSHQSWSLTTQWFME